MVGIRSAGLLFASLLLLFVPAPISVALRRCFGAALCSWVISYPALPALDAPPNVGFWAGVALGAPWVRRLYRMAARKQVLWCSRRSIHG